MRLQTSVLSALLLLQFAAAVAFVPFMSHLIRIWNNQEMGWVESYAAEYAQSGGIMLVEFIVIALVLLLTIGFEIWLIVKGIRSDRDMGSKLNKISQKLGIDDESI